MSTTQPPTIDLAKWADLVTKVGEDRRSTKARVLYYGDTGSGKTHASATWPKPFILDADKGLKGVASTIPDVPKVEVPFDRRGAMALVRDILTKFKDRTGPFAAGAPYADRETLVLDSVTALGDIAMNELMKYPPNPGWKVRDPIKDKPEFDHWGAFRAYFVEIANILKDIGDAHVVVTATAFVKENEAMRTTAGLPELQGSMKGSLGKFFDIVLYLECDGGKYYAHTKKRGLFIAKARGTGWPDKVENPVYANLAQYLK